VQVVLGVSGGIAAYKAAEIVRGLRRDGADVTVVMTRNACRFITPLTLQTLSGRRVITSHFDPVTTEEGDVEHVELSRGCDVLLIAPATANVLAKMAAGIADDFLTTFCLAVAAPVVVAPAMNTRMWRHPSVAQNLATLRARGVIVVEPEFGPLASPGEGEGVGRLADPDRVIRAALDAARERGPAPGTPAAGRLSGRGVLVTAGPTREPLDPVRYISNPSTGRMGYEIASAAVRCGARVVLVSGPTHLADPPGATTLRVATAEQMRRAVLDHLDGIDVVIKCAAVSDFRPAAPVDRKVKKTEAPRAVQLEPTPDILAELGRKKGKRFLVGFAAETEDLVANARRKLGEKNLDLIVANSVAGPDGAFGSSTNEVILLDPHGSELRWPAMSKREVADRLMGVIEERIG